MGQHLTDRAGLRPGTRRLDASPVCRPTTDPAIRPRIDCAGAVGLDSALRQVSHRRMADEYSEVISEMVRMQDRLRAIRERHCEPKSNDNPRYLALSSEVSALNRAIADMSEEES